MNTLLLLLTITTSTLVLRSGDRITVEGPVREENGVITFRMNGLLYSLPASEVVSRSAEAEPAPQQAPRRLKVSPEERDRLLRELERNHSGTPAPPSQTIPPAPPPPSPAEVQKQKQEEQYWRSLAREHEEAVRHAQEDLQLLEERISRLEGEIRTFVSLGFEPRQFTYQTARLVTTKEQLPAARLRIARAERALAQLREDARREGILPGWLRD